MASCSTTDVKGDSKGVEETRSSGKTAALEEKGSASVEKETSEVVPDAFGDKEQRRAWSEKVDFEDYRLIHERVRDGKGVPSQYDMPGKL